MAGLTSRSALAVFDIAYPGRPADNATFTYGHDRPLTGNAGQNPCVIEREQVRAQVE